MPSQYRTVGKQVRDPRLSLQARMHLRENVRSKITFHSIGMPTTVPWNPSQHLEDILVLELMIGLGTHRDGVVY